MTGVVANHPCLQSNGIPKGCQGRQRTAAVHFTLYNPLGILLFRDTFSVENSDLSVDVIIHFICGEFGITACSGRNMGPSGAFICLFDREW